MLATPESVRTIRPPHNRTIAAALRFSTIAGVFLSWSKTDRWFSLFFVRVGMRVCVYGHFARVARAAVPGTISGCGPRSRRHRPGRRPIASPGRGLREAHVIEARADFRRCDASDRVGCRLRDALDAGLHVGRKTVFCWSRAGLPSVPRAMYEPIFRTTRQSRSVAHLHCRQGKRVLSRVRNRWHFRRPAISAYGQVRPRQGTRRGSWRSCPTEANVRLLRVQV